MYSRWFVCLLPSVARGLVSINTILSLGVVSSSISVQIYGMMKLDDDNGCEELKML